LTTARESFAAALRQPGRQRLLEVAAQVPLYAEPECEPQRVLQQVDAWSVRLRARLPQDASPLARLRLLNHFYFAELGFTGAGDDYQAAENSFLHRVIERRRGIPITLSLLYMEIGRAAGLRLDGVCFPGHFLVRLALGSGAACIDVYSGGITLTGDDLRARLTAMLPDETDLAPYLLPATEQEILARLLRNLKAIHWQASEWRQALEIADRLVLVLPDSAQERFDRARIYETLECPRAAVADLQAYLAMRPSPPDEAAARERLALLQQAAARLN
jgi:regulator of sirC expression with transglutaminase-like and TPR domain